MWSARPDRESFVGMAAVVERGDGVRLTTVMVLWCSQRAVRSSWPEPIADSEAITSFVDRY